MKNIKFLDHMGTFTVEQPENYSNLYFPIAGEAGLKSSLTPNLGGDCKLNQNQFLMEPVSVENLHNNRSTRNFWCVVEGEGSWSALGSSALQEAEKFTQMQDDSTLTAGFMWHKMTRRSMRYGLRAEVTSFIPVSENAEITYVVIGNCTAIEKKITGIAAMPIYGRSADNIRDHRHVTSLLHRITTRAEGVCVKPSMSFDERGHQENETIYYVCGSTGHGENPKAFYPDVACFLGEGGTYTNPKVIRCATDKNPKDEVTARRNRDGVPAGYQVDGQEALGGLRFAQASIAPGESVAYIIVSGIAGQEEELEQVLTQYRTTRQVELALEETKNYWNQLVNVSYHTGDENYDNYLRWISFQPILRRIYGCSFLPHHDYGRGGRGWRDLWQDCLSLLLMEPQVVRQMILDNYGGVRIDGTNATIIGEKQGEFVADRNHIARVWMDHGFWPFLTTELYMNQTGDLAILKEEQTYFKDGMTERGKAKDARWSEKYGERQKTVSNEVYRGTILEHILLENLGAFFDVGEHNHMLLRGADWNDALDMAGTHGESVAFTSAYAGNLRNIAKYIRRMAKQTNTTDFFLMEEMRILLGDSAEMYEDVKQKRKLLSDFLKLCRHNISGKKLEISAEELALNLEHKAQWIIEHIRRTEWLGGNQSEGWFNSYYDDHKKRVEGYHPLGTRMMLTGQVFTIMSGTAQPEQVRQIVCNADRYLYDAAAGGYRLNTDFHEKKMDLGRMFGFAYGEKENGAVFSHMTIMYANALYQRGFVREGYRALQTLTKTAMNFDVSRIYPGIPEYFNGEGRGMYHYLTGAASWYMLTMITQVFGVRGDVGNLMLEPKLVAQQFDRQGDAAIETMFAGAKITVTIHNPSMLDYEDYQVMTCTLDGKLIEHSGGSNVIIDRKLLMKKCTHDIELVLERKETRDED